MSPNVRREGPIRLFFCSREEPRMHVQVSHPDGETRFWRVPAAALAKAVGLTARQLADAQDVVEQELLVRFQDFPWFRQATIEALTRVE